MATTTELIALGGRQVGILFLMDGIELGFTDTPDLVGYSTGASHTIRLGLQRDGLTCKLAINLRDGQFLQSPATVRLVDFSSSGELARLFASNDTSETSLGDEPYGAGLPVHPSSDLTGRPDLDNKDVGLERIGANGARHQYAVPPGFTIGLDHSITTPALDLSGAPVSDNPIAWNGRRCALYLVFRDHVTYPDRDTGSSSWRPFSEARRIWCGTMRDAGKVSGRDWTLELDGPDSLLRKPLAVDFAPKPVPAVGEFTLITSGSERDDGMAFSLTLINANGTVAEYGSSVFTTNITATNVDDMRAEVIAELTATAGVAGPDGAWDDQEGHTVDMASSGAITIAVPSQVGVAIPPGAAAGKLSICLHRKRWSDLGYDVEYQNALPREPDDPRSIEFGLVGVSGSFVAANNFGPDYWVADFWTGRLEWPNEDGSALSNNGQPRTYEPLYPDGTAALLAGLNGGRGQVVRLGDATLGGGASQSTVAHPGQLAWPVASLPGGAASSPVAIDGVDCDRAGWWLFLGKRRYRGTEEVYDERWIGWACWKNGSAQQDGLVSGDVIIVMYWADPKKYGYRTKGGVDSDWLALEEASVEGGQIQAIPLAMLGYQWALDEAHVVLQKLLHTTGTSTGWSSYDQNAPTPDAGDNEPSGVISGTGRHDCEIASLGLGIPNDWIASPAMFGAERDKLENDAIAEVKIAFTAGYQAEDVARSLMGPVGWSWHFRDGQFGIWCPSDMLTLTDATVALNTTVRVERHGQAGTTRLRQQLRKWQPTDKFKIAADWKPYERTARNPFERLAPDPQMRYRPGEVTTSVLAHGMRGEGDGLAERLLKMSRWYAMRHFEVTAYAVAGVRPGLDLWPGTIVRLTDRELLDPSSGYGVTNRIAIVTGTQRTFGDDTLGMTVDLLVIGSNTSTPRINAAVAQAWGHDSGALTIDLKTNWASVQGDGTWTDSAAFIEPDYTGGAVFGGNALIECWQWDGNSWALGMTADVVSVTSTTISYSSSSGTYHRDKDTWVVMRPTAYAQGAWVDALYSPIGDAAGEWDDLAVATAIYPWEE